MNCVDVEENNFEKFKTGDQTSFENIYNLHKEKLYRYTLRYVKNPELAYDIVQESFIRLWERKEHMLNSENVQGFLYLTAKNSAINTLKRASVDLKVRSNILAAYTFPTESEVEYYVIDREYAKYISEILDRLPEQTKAVFTKCKFENMSYDEVSEELGISRNTVKKHMVRALKTFREDKVIQSIGFNSLVICLLFNM